LGDKITRSQKRVIKSLSPKKPSFNDYLEAALKQNINILEHRKKIWREYFKCISILRNKVSHSDCSLSSSEKDLLMHNGFSAVVNGTELQFNSRNYVQICNHVSGEWLHKWIQCIHKNTIENNFYHYIYIFWRLT